MLSPTAPKCRDLLHRFSSVIKPSASIARQFGDVYRAHDPRLDRIVALKILRRQQPAHATVIEEAHLQARVSHPTVVTVYGAERIGSQVGVWMNFIDGPTLEDELRTRGPFHPLAVARIGLDLCAALDAVHRAGVVHHDVKTQNVMRAAARVAARWSGRRAIVSPVPRSSDR